MSDKRSLRPKKSLSQNFLVDSSISRKIALSLEPQENETVVEIGPGTGALTRQLLPLCSKLICVELDDRAVEQLQLDFAEELNAKMRLHHMDFLEYSLIDCAAQAGAAISVIGNIPYAISSPILFHVFDNAQVLRCAVMMMQKEVAQRLVASVGSKEYGVLSLAAQTACKAKMLFDVKPGSFFPRPSVTSSVVRMTFAPIIEDHEEVRQLRFLIRAAFGQRRKTLRNALESYALQKHGIALRPFDWTWLDKRAEQLSLDDFRGVLEQLRAEAVK